MIHQLGRMMAKSNNKLKAHNMKLGKYSKNKIDRILCCCYAVLVLNLKVEASEDELSCLCL